MYNRVLAHPLMPVLGAVLCSLLLFPGASLAASNVAQQVPVQIPPSTNSNLQGVWAGTNTHYGDDTTVDAADPNAYTIDLLPGGRLSIKADCNSGIGTYTVSGSMLRITIGAMTLAACGPESQDTIFLRDLGQVSSYVFDGEQLVLNLRLDSGDMFFSPMPPATLTGVDWRVQGVNNGHGGVASVVADTQPSMTFGDNGIVNGNTGCNTFNGPYSVDGSTIAFGALATTRRACLSDAAKAQEQAFLTALNKSTSYELLGDRLTLRDAGGATQLILVTTAQ